ncbi:histidine phosphatase superfamily [Immersiella caudata]|uniref:Histidine phosphatase superfamily n=1 Tax=Immersiella caudata TaxID=314043 RepID=A0AA39WEI0_9PEZI|nr:histidine phosphatase superfamily [Immersiella caudata]
MAPPPEPGRPVAPSSRFASAGASRVRLPVVTKTTAVVLLGALPLFLSVMWLSCRPVWSSVLRHGGGLLLSGAVVGADAVDLGWYPPARSWINNLTAVINDEGVRGFVFNSSETPVDIYGTYNWCNMPHVRDTEYIKPDDKYQLVYVELIHRHHKRTPYQDNSFPVEPYAWDCDDVQQYHHSTPVPVKDNQTASPAYWKPSPHLPNPFTPSGWRGTCSFPQITGPGLLDSWQHGTDLYAIYHTLHGLLPSRSSPAWRSVTAYHVTNNPITTQVISSILHGTWRTTIPVPLLIQPPQTDPLEPRYLCPAASRLRTALESSPLWKSHLTAASPLFTTLDSLSGVPPSDTSFHVSIDHYYDNLSARECHSKPLPCLLGSDPAKCITRDLADAAYRLGQWEYDYLYRSAGPETLAFAVASFGVWIAQLAGNLRAMVEGRGREVVYRHHVAHDGSLSRLLGILQAEEMVWPGMGAEVVFELYREGERGEYYVRLLFGGRVLKSSNPSLGRMEMLRVEVLLGYFEGLAGVDGVLVVGKCK